MTKDRDGKHAGGSIVDTARANTSPEQIEEDNESRAKQQQADQNKEKQS